MTKKEVYNILATYAVKTAKAQASDALAKQGKKLEPRNGRTLSVSTFIEYLESVPLTSNIPAAVAVYLTSETPHEFEVAKINAERKRAKREASEKAISDAFGEY